MIRFDRSICSNIEQAGQREWLVTNGIGGFACGTIPGVLTRHYHGLLIAALKPPLGRTLLLAKLDETAYYNGIEYPLFANRWVSGLVHPAGYDHLESFRLERSIPTWGYTFDVAGLEKRVWMQPRSNTTYIQYTFMSPGASPLELDLRVLVSPRDMHAVTHAEQAPDIRVNPLPDGIRVTSADLNDPWYIFCQRGSFSIEAAWERNLYLVEEARRGEPSVEDQLAVAHIHAVVQPGDEITIVASTQNQPHLDGKLALAERRAYEDEILSAAKYFPGASARFPNELGQLLLAADQFIVKRPSPSNPEGETVIAGYPWFSDWGRDTMISLPGLAISTGRRETARNILLTFSEFVDQGMLPNRFPDHGETPEYNTIDAALWYFEAVRAYFESFGDHPTLKKLLPALEEIIAWHLKGTRYGIHCDTADGLLAGGEPGMQLTWMDVRIDGWTVTPRIGKPVEINALWCHALSCMVEFCEALGLPADLYREAGRRARIGFSRFWNPDHGYLFDVLDGPDGNDPALRPNQIIAASLKHIALPVEQARAVVDQCARSLLTPYGLRSLAPGEQGYIGNYRGDRWQRDSSYHQGTVWGWLIGPFISAHLRVYHDPQQAIAFLQPLFGHLSQAGLGTISEIFDGDPPFRPNGCFAQAWSVAEVLRVLGELERPGFQSTTRQD